MDRVTRYLRRAQRTRGDAGSALVLALIFVSIFGLVTTALLSFGFVGERTDGVVRGERDARYAADGALDGAIQRYQAMVAGGTANPCASGDPFFSYTVHDKTANVTCTGSTLGGTPNPPQLLKPTFIDEPNSDFYPNNFSGSSATLFESLHSLESNGGKGTTAKTSYPYASDNQVMLKDYRGDNGGFPEGDTYQQVVAWVGHSGAADQYIRRDHRHRCRCGQRPHRLRRVLGQGRDPVGRSVMAGPAVPDHRHHLSVRDRHLRRYAAQPAERHPMRQLPRGARAGAGHLLRDEHRRVLRPALDRRCHDRGLAHDHQRHRQVQAGRRRSDDRRRFHPRGPDDPVGDERDDGGVQRIDRRGLERVERADDAGNPCGFPADNLDSVLLCVCLAARPSTATPSGTGGHDWRTDYGNCPDLFNNWGTRELVWSTGTQCVIPGGTGTPIEPVCVGGLVGNCLVGGNFNPAHASQANFQSPVGRVAQPHLRRVQLAGRRRGPARDVTDRPFRGRDDHQTLRAHRRLGPRVVDRLHAERQQHPGAQPLCDLAGAGALHRGPPAPPGGVRAEHRREDGGDPGDLHRHLLAARRGVELRGQRLVGPVRGPRRPACSTSTTSSAARAARRWANFVATTGDTTVSADATFGARHHDQ